MFIHAGDRRFNEIVHHKKFRLEECKIPFRVAERTNIPLQMQAFTLDIETLSAVAFKFQPRRNISNVFFGSWHHART